VNRILKITLTLALAVLASAPAVHAGGTKPPSGSALDTGGSLYSALTAAFGFLENTGTTSTDAKGGIVATFSSSPAPAWSSDSEGPFIHCTADEQYLTLGSNIVIPINTSFSLAWGTKNISAQSAICGNRLTSSNYMIQNTNSTLGMNQPLIGNQTYNDSLTSSVANRNDYVASFSYSGGSYTVNLYENGTLQTSSPYTTAANASTWTINSICKGLSSTGFGMRGDLYYLYICSGTALSSTDATNLRTNPYFVYQYPVSFTSSPSTIPANHAGNITLTLAGTNTTWTSGSTVTKTVLSGSPTVTLGTWTRTSNTAATQVVTTGSGTGTFKVTIDGHDSPTLTVATASVSTFGSYGGTSLTEPITLTGVNTLWSADSPTFSIGGAGNSIGSISVASNTSATAVVTCGSVNGAYTITDPSTGAICTFNVATPYTYDLTDASIYGHYIQMEGAPALGTFGGITSWSGPQDCAIRFRGSIGQIDVFAVTAQYTTFRLAIDRVPQNAGATQAQVDSGGVHAWKPHASGLDTATEHEYLVYFGSTSGTAMYCAKIRVFGGTGLNTAALAARPLVTGIGDSVMTGAGIPGFDSTQAFMAQLGMTSRYQVANRATGSRAISSGGGAGTGVVGNLSSYAGLSPAPAVLYFLDGVVDVLDSYSTTTFGTDYATCIAAFRTDYPNALIICAKIQPNGPSGAALTVVDPYNAQIAAKQAAAADAKMPLSSVIHDLVVTEGLTGYHAHVAESVQWAAAMASEIDTLLVSGTSSGVQSGGRLGGKRSGIRTGGSQFLPDWSDWDRLFLPSHRWNPLPDWARSPE
jgi:hypothetical protein